MNLDEAKVEDELNMVLRPLGLERWEEIYEPDPQGLPESVEEIGRRIKPTE